MQQEKGERMRISNCHQRTVAAPPERVAARAFRVVQPDRILEGPLDNVEEARS